MTNLEFNNAELKALDNAEMNEIDGGIWQVVAVYAGIFVLGAITGALQEANKN